MLLLFLHCKGQEQEQAEKKISLERIYEAVRRLDNTALMPDFKPDSSFYIFHEELLSLYYPPKSPVTRNDISSIKEVTRTIWNAGANTETSTQEYKFQNGKLVTVVESDSIKTNIKTIQYGISGLPERFTTYDPVNIDSIAEIFHYNLHKRLTKIEMLNSAGKIMQTKSFNYDASGNITTMDGYNSGSKEFTDHFFLNNKKRSSLAVKTNEEGNIMGAIYTVRDSLGRRVHEEVFNNYNSQPVFTKIGFVYNADGDFELLLTKVVPQNQNNGYTFSYLKKDSKGMWTEKQTFMNKQLMESVNRSIKYIGQ